MAYGTLPVGHATGSTNDARVESRPTLRRSTLLRVGVAALAVAALLALISVAALRHPTREERLAAAPSASGFFASALAGLRRARHSAAKARVQQLEEVPVSQEASDLDDGQDAVDRAKALVEEAKDRVIEDAQRLKHVSDAISEESAKSAHAETVHKEQVQGAKDAQDVVLSNFEQERAELIAARQHAEAMAVAKMAEAEEARMPQAEAEAVARSASARAAVRQQRAGLLQASRRQRLDRAEAQRAVERERAAENLRAAAVRDESRVGMAPAGSAPTVAAAVVGGAPEGGETIINVKKLVVNVGDGRELHNLLAEVDPQLQARARAAPSRSAQQPARAPRISDGALLRDAMADEAEDAALTRSLDVAPAPLALSGLPVPPEAAGVSQGESGPAPAMVMPPFQR